MKISVEPVRTSNCSSHINQIFDCYVLVILRSIWTPTTFGRYYLD